MEPVTLPAAGAAAGRPAGAAAAAGAARRCPSRASRASTGVRRHRLPGEPGVRLARACCSSRATLLLTALLVHQMWLVLSIGGLTGVEKAMLGALRRQHRLDRLRRDLAADGLHARPRAARRRRTRRPRGRTALLMPTYNEDPARIVGAACAMLRAIDADGGGSAFDLFILSDTNRADVWLAEQAMVDAARADPAIGPRLYYRHRAPQPARARPATSPTGSSAGAAPTPSCWCSTPTA